MNRTRTLIFKELNYNSDAEKQKRSQTEPTPGSKGSLPSLLPVQSSAVQHMLVHVGLPAGCRKALEAMSAELNGANPSFTIRRNIQQALDDQVLVDELKKVIDDTFLLIGFIDD